MKRLLLPLLLPILPIPAQAGAPVKIACSFVQECRAGKPCRAMEAEDVLRARQTDGAGYGIVINAGIAATGLSAKIEGAMGTVISKDRSAMAPCGDIHTLSYAPAGAVMTRAGLDPDGERPWTTTFMGTFGATK